MGAKMVDFNGWEMPVEYPSAGGIIVEHNAVRTGVGIFDVSHMGDIRLSGLESLAAVQHISMNDASRLAVGPTLLTTTADLNPPAVVAFARPSPARRSVRKPTVAFGQRADVASERQRLTASRAGSAP